jgi:hypothetical protein
MMPNGAGRPSEEDVTSQPCDTFIGCADSLAPNLLIRWQADLATSRAEGRSYAYTTEMATKWALSSMVGRARCHPVDTFKSLLTTRRSVNRRSVIKKHCETKLLSRFQWSKDLECYGKDPVFYEWAELLARLPILCLLRKGCLVYIRRFQSQIYTPLSMVRPADALARV